MRYCEFKRLHQAFIVADNRGANERTSSRTRRQHTLEMQSFPRMNTVYGLMKDPHQPIARHWTKAWTPLVSHKKGDVIRSPNYRYNTRKVRTTNGRYGEAKCGYDLGGISWSLNCTYHTGLASIPTTTTSWGRYGKVEASLALSAGDWMTCSPHLLALALSITSPQEGSLC